MVYISRNNANKSGKQVRGESSSARRYDLRSDTRVVEQPAERQQSAGSRLYERGVSPSYSEIVWNSPPVHSLFQSPTSPRPLTNAQREVTRPRTEQAVHQESNPNEQFDANPTMPTTGAVSPQAVAPIETQVPITAAANRNEVTQAIAENVPTTQLIIGQESQANSNRSISGSDEDHSSRDVDYDPGQHEVLQEYMHHVANSDSDPSSSSSSSSDSTSSRSSSDDESRKRRKRRKNKKKRSSKRSKHHRHSSSNSSDSDEEKPVKDKNIKMKSQLSDMSSYERWHAEIKLILIEHDLWISAFQRPVEHNISLRYIMSSVSDRVFQRLRFNTVKSAQQAWKRILVCFKKDPVHLRANFDHDIRAIQCSANDTLDSYFEKFEQLNYKYSQAHSDNVNAFNERLVNTILAKWPNPNHVFITNVKFKLRTGEMPYDMDNLRDLIMMDEHHAGFIRRVSSWPKSERDAKPVASSSSQRTRRPEAKRESGTEERCIVTKVPKSVCYHCNPDKAPPKCKECAAKNLARWHKDPSACPNRKGRPPRGNMAISTTHDMTHKIVLDSGASWHITHPRSWAGHFIMRQPPTDKTAPKYQVLAADGNFMKILAIGDITMKVGGKDILLRDVLVTLEAVTTLISVSKLTEDKYSVLFNEHGAVIGDEDGPITSIIPEDGSYEIEGAFHPCKTSKEDEEHSVVAQEHTEVKNVSESKEERDTRKKHFTRLADVQPITAEWTPKNSKVVHDRLGHPSASMMRYLSLSIGGPVIKEIACDCCEMMKASRKPFKTVTVRRATVVGQLVHADIGFMPIMSYDEHVCYLLSIDEYSGYIHIRLMNSKRQGSEMLKNIIDQYALDGHHVKTIRTDNDRSLTVKGQMKYEVKHETTAAYSSQMNGMAERAIRTICSISDTALFKSGLAKNHWSDSIIYAVQSYNIWIHPSRSLCETPYEYYHGKEPKFHKALAFGERVFVKDLTAHKKIDVKAKRMMFIAYAKDMNAYVVMDPNTNQHEISRDVNYAKIPVYMTPDELPNINNDVQAYKRRFDDEPEEDELNQKRVKTSPSSEAPGPLLAVEPISKHTADINVANQLPRRLRHRIVKRGISLSAFMSNIRIDEKPIAVEDNIPYQYRDIAGLPDADEYYKAVDVELENMKRNNVWTESALPEGKRAVSMRWVFALKHDSSGRIAKYKARLVARGFSQTHNQDYFETYSPVVRYTTLRIVLHLATANNWVTEVIDVVAAFLLSDLEEDVYVEFPEGCKWTEHKTAKLNRAIYGLKQASRSWYNEVTERILHQGWSRCDDDPCLFIKSDNSGNIMIILIYVDDIALISNSANNIQDMKKMLGDKFPIKELGPIGYYLHMDIKRDNEGTASDNMHISHHQKVAKVLKHANMADCKPLGTPMDTGMKLTLNMQPQTDAETQYMKMVPYRSIIGQLMYIAINTRPDIYFATIALSRYNNNPGVKHWEQVKNVLRYLKATSTHGLKIGGGGMEISAYADASHAACVDTRKSVSGYVIQVGNTTISWNSKYQANISLSSTEAEYYAISECIQETLCIRRIMAFIGYEQKEPTKLYNDNQSCIKILKNNLEHTRMRHIDTRMHFCREYGFSKEIEICYQPSQELKADMMTKVLSPALLKKHRESCSITERI